MAETKLITSLDQLEPGMAWGRYVFEERIVEDLWVGYRISVPYIGEMRSHSIYTQGMAEGIFVGREVEVPE